METQSKHMQTVLPDNRAVSYCLFSVGMYGFHLKVKLLKFCHCSVFSNADLLLLYLTHSCYILFLKMFVTVAVINV